MFPGVSYLRVTSKKMQILYILIRYLKHYLRGNISNKQAMKQVMLLQTLFVRAAKQADLESLRNKGQTT